MPRRAAAKSSNDEPLVSVIVPAWNAEDTLLNTLRSAAAQTYRNIEIVIVDDGSTDRTAAVTAEFCAREQRARLIRQENLGRSAARNRGLRESRGPWIAPLDADDLWHETKIQKQVEAALAAPKRPGLVYCWYRDIDERGFILGSGPRWAFDGSAFKRLAYQNILHAVLLSRAAAEAVGGYDEALDLCEDVLLQLRIARDYPVAVVPEHLLGYRKRANSLSRDAEMVVRSWRQVLARLAREGADIDPRLRRWIDAFFRKILAEGRIGRGAYGQALLLFLGAARRDPIRWGSYGLYRLTRTALRLVRGRRPKPEPAHFDAVDPAAFISTDPDRIAVLDRLLTRLDRQRVRRLQASERLSGG
jgi:glycosyltransferase involved in cell wall biosynthesis